MDRKTAAILVLSILIAGIGVGTYLTQRQQTLRSQAAPSTNIEIIEPVEDELISGKIKVAAEVKTNIDPAKLYGFFKVDGQSHNLKFRKIDQNTTSLSGISETDHPNGDYTLEVFLYSLETGTPALIGQTSRKISVSNE